MLIKFLGTGAGLPSRFRNTQSFILSLMQELKECWMFDCGEAAQHKILQTTIKPTKINRIFITHMHGDHILGLVGFLSSRSFQLADKEQPLYIYGPLGIKDYVELNLKMIKAILPYSIKFVEFSGEKCIIDTDRVSVNTFSLNHTIECYGFKINFKEQKGSLLIDKLKDIGMEPGPLYREVKEQSYFMFNGKEYNSKDFLSENKKGKMISIISDTKYFDDLNEFVKDSDILISECTYLKETEQKLANQYKHLCINDIMNLISKNNFEKIFLTHISSRYDKEFIANLKDNFSSLNIEVAEDLSEYCL